MYSHVCFRFILTYSIHSLSTKYFVIRISDSLFRFQGIFEATSKQWRYGRSSRSSLFSQKITAVRTRFEFRFSRNIDFSLPSGYSLCFLRFRRTLSTTELQEEGTVPPRGHFHSRLRVEEGTSQVRVSVRISVCFRLFPFVSVYFRLVWSAFTGSTENHVESGNPRSRTEFAARNG